MASLGFYQWVVRVVVIGMQLSRSLGHLWNSNMGGRITRNLDFSGEMSLCSKRG